MKTVLLAVATLSFYTLALILTAIAARRRALGGAVFAGALGLLLHGVLVVQALLDDGGLRFDLPASLLLIAWLVMLGCLVLALFQALPALLLIGIPVIALTVVTALGLPPAAVDPLHPDPWLDAHVLLAVLAYASLSVACLLAVLLAIADHRLHSHRLGPRGRVAAAAGNAGDRPVPHHRGRFRSAHPGPAQRFRLHP
ncbi:MAG: hypothetical protein KatS3mg121_0511 [Gammaproteobacteria bacterium]|nr:MAG: hypothetical protein KatS3mg121_0511 [Gammaproteobacteria bacterium]